MTDREAIGILSNYYAYCNLTSQVKQAQLVALKALQELEERARGCECGSYFITHPYTFGYSIKIDPKQKEISIWLYDECVAVMDCAFCPRCGRPLETTMSEEEQHG